MANLTVQQVCSSTCTEHCCALDDVARADAYQIRRFLKARNWDLHAARQMWVDYLNWRAEHRVDSILEWFQFTEKKEFLSIYPHGLHKVDRMVSGAS